MTNYININQGAFSKFKGLDLIDATIFQWIVVFSHSPKAKKKLIDNKLFIWGSYQKIIDDNPLMGISSKKAIELRVKKLIECGLIDKITCKEEGNRTYFNVTEKAYTLVIENTNLSNEDYQPLSNEDYYNSKLNNSELNSNKKTNKKSLIEEFTESYVNRFGYFPSTGEMDIVEWFVEHRRKIKSPIKTVKAISAFLNHVEDCKLFGHLFSKIKKIMEEKEWKSVKKEWLDNLNRSQNSTSIVTTNENSLDYENMGEF